MPGGLPGGGGMIAFGIDPDITFAGDCGKMHSPVLFVTVDFAGLRGEDAMTSRGEGKGYCSHFFVMKRGGGAAPSVLQILTQ